MCVTTESRSYLSLCGYWDRALEANFLKESPHLPVTFIQTANPKNSASKSASLGEQNVQLKKGSSSFVATSARAGYDQTYSLVLLHVAAFSVVSGGGWTVNTRRRTK